MLSEGSGEVKANVGPASSKGILFCFPSHEEIFRASLRRRCPDPRTQAAAPAGTCPRWDSSGSVVCGVSLESSGNQCGSRGGCETKQAQSYRLVTTSHYTGGSRGDPLLQTPQGQLPASQRKKA